MNSLDRIRSRAEGRRLGEYRSFEHVRPGLCFVQGDQSIANQAGAAFRGDLNNELQALVTLSSGASAPGTTYAHQLWADTTTNLLKKRNAANSAWIVVRTLDESFVLSRASNTILAGSDVGKTIVSTSTFTQTLTAAATLADGWWIAYRNDGVGVITIDPNGAEQIDGAATIDLGPTEACLIFCNGASFKTIGRKNGEYRSVQVFTASGTYTAPAGLKRARITVIGGGGASGGCAATAGGQAAGAGGGASGGAAIKTVSAATIGASQTVTIGAGGTVGTAGNNPGNGGGTTSFGAIVSATGGGGGEGSPNITNAGFSSGGTPGTGSSGDINITGQGGGLGACSAVSTKGAGGLGGSSILGGGAPSVATVNTTTGTAGGNYGAGSSGSASGQSQPATTGTAGASGIVIVEEFF